jgi:hypothetical protein
MGEFLNWRRRLELLVLAFLTLFAFAAMNDEWIGWATMITMFAVLVIVDFMFLDDSAFIYDPSLEASVGGGGGGGAPGVS